MKKVIAIIVIFLLNFSCKDNKEISSLMFKEYISGFSSGYVHRDEAIRVVLTSEVAKDKLKGMDVDELLYLSPSVKGKVSVVGNEVVFKPSERLKSDTEYKVTLDLFKIFDIKDSKLDRFSFKIKTNKALFSVEPRHFQSYSKEWYYLNLDILSSERMSDEEIKKSVSGEFDGKDLKMKVMKSGGFVNSVILDSIPAKKEGNVEIKWDGDDVDMESEGSVKVGIPDSGKMEVDRILLWEEDPKVFSIGFSQPLDSSQMFEGLVQLTSKDSVDVKDIKYSTSGNVLKVYLPKVFEGKYTVDVYSGVMSTYGDKLEKGYRKDIEFRDIKPAIKFVNSGSILPSSQNMQVFFETVNLKAVEVKVKKIYQNNVLQYLQDNDLDTDYYSGLYKVGKVVVHKIVPIYSTDGLPLSSPHINSLDLSSLISVEPGAVYNVSFLMRKEFSTSCNDDKKIEEENLMNEEEERDGDYYEEGYYGEDYDWNQRENPCNSAYYSDKNVTTNILATDLGVIVKRGQSNDYFVAVNNIISTNPVNGANIELFDYQKQVVGSGSTNGEGICNIKTSSKAYFAVVFKDKFTTYLKIDDANSLSLSSFDVTGQEFVKGRNAMIYKERGVYRPGDSVSVGFVFNDYANKLPLNHPIKITFKDPFGKVVNNFVKSSNKENHYIFKLKIPDGAPTGNWNCEIGVGASRYSENIKVETIKPNRLKIYNSLADNVIGNGGKKGEVAVSWLQGNELVGSFVDISAKLYQGKTEFRNFKNYVFENVSDKFEGREINVYSGKTDGNGKVYYSFNPTNLKVANGFVKVNLITKANEEGGDFSTDVCSAVYSPFSSYVGLKLPDAGEANFLQTEKEHTFDVAVVSENGEGLSGKPVEVIVFRMEDYWWWDASYTGISKYTSSSTYQRVNNFKLTTNSEGKASFKIKKSNEEWGGYFVLVIDKTSLHQSGMPVIFDYGYGSRGKKGKDATVISVGTDKKKYVIGEKLKVVFPSSEGGRALVSVENYSKVVKTYWVQTQKGETSLDIEITKEMAPNAYVYVTYIQPHKSFKSRNDSPIRMYGVTGFEVYDKNTKLEPVITCSNTFKPDSKVEVKVKEKNGKPMTYSLAIVEDGLLDLTRYKTPQIWDKFFSKTTLGVKTWDMYNSVIGAFGGKIKQVFSVGGDQELLEAKVLKASRFKPFVIVKGPFTTSRGGNTHIVDIPNYIGSARIMVVASDVENNSFGSSEKRVSINSPVMVLSSLPRKASAGEYITLPVTVFVNDSKIKNVSVSVKNNDCFSVEGDKTKKVSFNDKGEKMVYFTLKSLKNGVGKVWVEGVSGSEKGKYDVDMNIFNPNERVFKVNSVSVGVNSSKQIDFDVFGQKGMSRVKLEVSSVRPINLDKRVSYLISHPHGCSEQITSKAFAQLYLEKFHKLSSEQKSDIQKNVTYAIEKLYKNQLGDGGFSYWSGDSRADEWVTCYIGQFLIEAENMGFALPMGSKQNWINYQKNKTKSWNSLSKYETELQAYRLYTLSKAKAGDLASMNKLRENKNMTSQAKRLLSGAYYLLGQKKVSKELFSAEMEDYSDYEHYFGSKVRDEAMALEISLLVGRDDFAGELVKDITGKLSSTEWMSTQTTAYALYSVAKYIEKHNIGRNINISYTLDGKTKNLTSDTGLLSENINVSKGNYKIIVKNNSGMMLYALVSSSGVPDMGEEVEVKKGIDLSVSYVHDKGSVNEREIQQGTSFKAVIRVVNNTGRNLKNVAMTEYIPSGWEIVNTRFAEGGDYSVDYTDFRDDRVNMYFDLKNKEVKTFVIKLNASYKGKYYLPGACVGAMYDNRFDTKLKGKWVEVK